MQIIIIQNFIRNINFIESNIKFEQNGDSLNLETLLKTNDGGEIEIIYKSGEYDFIIIVVNYKYMKKNFFPYSYH